MLYHFETTPQKVVSLLVIGGGMIPFRVPSQPEKPGKVREFDLPRTCPCGVFIFTETKVHCNLRGPFELEISQNNYHGISNNSSGKNQGILFS